MESVKKSDVSEKPSEISWLEQLKDYFKVVSEKGKNVGIDVPMMPSKENAISASKISPANLMKHIKGQLKLRTFKGPLR
jgi:hypothetical protein